VKRGDQEIAGKQIRDALTASGKFSLQQKNVGSRTVMSLLCNSHKPVWSDAASNRMAAPRFCTHLHYAGWMAATFDRQLHWTVMNTHLTRPKPAPNDKLHPIVYRLIIGLAAWLVLSIWLLFDRGSYVVLILAVITTFFFIAVGVPLMIAFTWWHNSGAREPSAHAIRFREWLACEFTTRTGVLSAKAAAIQILLPIAAVSIGMTVFGLVLHFDMPNIG
jgi:hypothetical protein